ncbi:hypothetical protein MRS44_017117 [Fusarium solani]|uniref:Uncharacterized protein n=1 Tax=Fusarium solani TaxID=169388 RepID=A0A9P9GSS2_FUSSL|nr:uncharacterized protein B0J15DRAFT_451516 [Fusarium solani]KAH7243759.1 hypothetical protein B0J15DRAFT_451516 [Fusarium solani]KAJ3455635.1 hypothetical protein MRS44_017117 [Fusarium solani]
MPSVTAPSSRQSVVAIPLSDEERKSQTITNDHLAKAVSAMHRDGICVLENAVNIGHTGILNNILCAEAEEMAELPTTHFNDNSEDGNPTGNMSQGPPLQPELMYSDIWANGPAAAVLACMLGPQPQVNYVNGNTALGGFKGSRQRVHVDLTFNHAQFPFAIVANCYLADVSPANGSTELWIGSHRDTSVEMRRC